ncbi:hypothetical protein B0A49_05073 [Cryomyces minteri]|uniref:Uncharacterized protein n=1 Tax=Cryomyces minteri TaxID=331657 RepID=A0A4U0X511_9PEZI|nr:hypothetical protein B0A49_05073 [Cryomyces minteri]
MTVPASIAFPLPTMAFEHMPRSSYPLPITDSDRAEWTPDLEWDRENINHWPLWDEPLNDDVPPEQWQRYVKLGTTRMTRLVRYLSEGYFEDDDDEDVTVRRLPRALAKWWKLDFFESGTPRDKKLAAIVCDSDTIPARTSQKRKADEAELSEESQDESSDDELPPIMSIPREEHGRMVSEIIRLRRELDENEAALKTAEETADKSNRRGKTARDGRRRTNASPALLRSEIAAGANIKALDKINTKFMRHSTKMAKQLEQSARRSAVLALAFAEYGKAVGKGKLDLAIAAKKSTAFRGRNQRMLDWMKRALGPDADKLLEAGEELGEGFTGGAEPPLPDA